MSKFNSANPQELVAVRLGRLHRTFRHALGFRIRELISAIENVEFEAQSAQSKRDKLRIKKIA